MQPEGWGQDPDLWPRASAPSLYRCLHCSCQLQGSGDGDFHLSTCFQVGGSGVPTYMVHLFFNFLYANESACWTCMVGGRKATLLRPFLLCHLVLWEWPPERLTWYSVGSTGSERSSRYLGAYRWMSLCITYVVFFFFSTSYESWKLNSADYFFSRYHLFKPMISGSQTPTLQPSGTFQLQCPKENVNIQMMYLWFF